MIKAILDYLYIHVLIDINKSKSEKKWSSHKFLLPLLYVYTFVNKVYLFGHR